MGEYNPFKLTALKRKSLSVPMRELYKRGLLKGDILDYGCGFGDDICYLKLKSINIKGYDKFNEEYKVKENLEESYDVVTCNYIFNVIFDLEEHSKVIELLRKSSKNIYISVRSDFRAIKLTWKYIEENDCYLTTTGSYQRFYDDEMIDKYFGEVEYLINNSSLKLFKLK